MEKLTAQQVKCFPLYAHLLKEGLEYGVNLTPLLKKMMGYNFCPKKVICTTYTDVMEFAKAQRRWYFATIEGDIKNADSLEWSALDKQTTAYLSEDGQTIHIAKYIPDKTSLESIRVFWELFDNGENPVKSFN